MAADHEFKPACPGGTLCAICGIDHRPAYGPGHPDFDAEFRRRWVEQMRVLLWEKVPDMTDAKFDEIIAAFDKGRDQFIEDMKRK